MSLDLTTNQAQDILTMYKSKQTRSKFDHLSTYTICRASSNIASRLNMQPTTKWALSDQSDQTTTIQVKLVSILLHSIAIQVIKNGCDAVLTVM